MRDIIMGSPMVPPSVGGIRVNIMGIRVKEQKNTRCHGCETLFENFDPNC